MSLEFLSPRPSGAASAAPPVARSPMEHAAAAAGAQFASRDGWRVATGYGYVVPASPVAWADASHLGKLELSVPAGRAAALAALVGEATGGGSVGLGSALRAGDAWWCGVTPERALVLAEPGRIDALREAAQDAAEGTAARVVDVTTTFAALVVAGPQARQAIARFCALDLRPRAMPVGGFRPGSIARTPGFVLREGPDRYLLVFGAALGHYLWTVVADAGAHLGGAPVPYEPAIPEAQADA